MPAKPRWLLQIPEMIEQLRGLEVPVVDRAVVERTFGVRRRRAVELMRRFGGYLSGNTILLDRLGLIYQLEAVGAGADVIRERRRKERLSGKLDELHRYRAAAAVRIPLPAVTAGRMPEGVALEAGRLTVEFGSVEELLSRLYGLSQAAALDYDGFRHDVEEHLAGVAPAQMVAEEFKNIQEAVERGHHGHTQEELWGLPGHPGRAEIRKTTNPTATASISS